MIFFLLNLKIIKKRKRKKKGKKTQIGAKANAIDKTELAI
jgi:hypothetical protein